MNTFQREGQSPTGGYTCDTYVDADGMVCQKWRHATDAEARALAATVSPNYGAGKLFGYDQSEFMARQYRKGRK